MPEKQEKIKKVKTQECVIQSEQKIQAIEDKFKEAVKTKTEKPSTAVQQNNPKQIVELGYKVQEKGTGTLDNLDKRFKEFE